MTRFRWLPLALVAAAVWMVPSASANKPQAFSFASATGGGQFDYKLEKENDYPLPATGYLVNNHNGCVWDINDHSGAQTQVGYLNPGASSSVTNCVVWEYNPYYACKSGICAQWSSSSHEYGGQVIGSSPALNVSVCFIQQARCFLPAAVKTGRVTWKYSFCGQVVYQPGDPTMSLIPDAGGEAYGPLRQYGVISDVTLSVSNPTTVTAKQVQAFWGVSSDVFFAPSCTPEAQLTNRAYPFSWTSS